MLSFVYGISNGNRNYRLKLDLSWESKMKFKISIRILFHCSVGHEYSIRIAANYLLNPYTLPLLVTVYIAFVPETIKFMEICLPISF